MKNLFSKKIWLLVLVLCFAPLSFAQNYKEGSNRLSLMLGAGIPDSEVQGVEWGKTGFGFGAQYLHYLSENIAFGAEAQSINFGKEKDTDIEVDINNIAFAGRLNVNINELQRIYIPMGLGIANIKGKRGEISYEDSPLMGYVGLGLEADIDYLSDHFVFGIEGRYHWAHFDSDGIDEKVRYFSVLAMLGYRF